MKQTQRARRTDAVQAPVSQRFGLNPVSVAALMVLLGAGPVMAGTVSSVSPSTARLDVGDSLFTVKGAGLSYATLEIQDCVKAKGTPAKDTPTLVKFRCTPVLPGKKLVTSDGVVQVVGVKVDHPSRMGNPQARGVPAAQGVSSFNGNFFHQVTDMVVPGRGPAFTLSRSYNSYDAALESLRGGVSNYKPWRINWDLKIGYVPGKEVGREQIYVERPDGAGANFWLDAASGNWVPIDQGSFELLKLNDPVAGQATLYSRDGLRYTFEAPTNKAPGRLKQVADHDANALTVSFAANGKVGSVTDAVGRSYTFAYDNNDRLNTVTDFTGRFVQYTWESDLAPDGKTRRERIKKVRDVRGQISKYFYVEQDSPTVGKRILLSAMLNPRQAQTRIFYSDQVYGNFGVSRVERDLDTAGTFLTTAFSYCALQEGGACDNASPETALGFKSTITQPDSTTRVLRFDASGRRVEAVDGLGNPSTTTPRPDADLTTTTYKLAGLTDSSSSAQGNTTQYAYTPDDRGLVQSVTDAATNVTQQTWSGNAAINLHTLSSRSTPSGLTRAFDYTSGGNISKITQPDSGYTELSYNVPGQPGLPNRKKDPNGNLTNFDYTPQGLVNRVTDALGQVTLSEYDALGRVVKVTDPAGGVTLTEYDAGGNVTKVTDPLLRSSTSTYDGAGNLLTRTDPAGTVTSFAYDQLNRLTSTTVALPTGQIVTGYEYDVLGRVTKVTNPNGHATTTGYDAAGNPVSKANALLQASSYEYDKDGRVTRVTDPDGHVTDTSYDAMGRVTAVSTAAGTQQQYSYDGDGRVTQFSDALGRNTLYTYHPVHGRLWKVEDALHNITRAEYDLAGNVTEIWGPGKDTAGNYVRTQFNEYDALNRRVRSTDANGRVWLTSYDARGNVSSRTAPGGLVTSYTYDAANQLLQLTLPDQVITYTYDANGNRLTMADATGTTRYSYDTLNRLTQLKDPKKQTVKYTYDAASNRTRITYPDNKQVDYGFDAAERLVTVKDWLNKTTTYALKPSGQVESTTLGNGTRSAAVYDDVGRLKTLSHTDAAGTPISVQDLQRAANGNIEQIAATLPLLPSFTSSTTDMSYDPANRLSTVNGVAVTHDDAGRITGLNGASYSYDARDLLKSYTPATGSAATYTYNGAGQRVVKTVGGVVTRYVIDPNADLPNVIAETDNAGVLQRSYVYGYGLIEQIDAAGNASYYHHDITGHTLALTNAAGLVTDKYAYTPYGDTNSTGSTVNPFRYVGQYGVMDEGNGLHFMRARYYRSDVSRFLGLDAVEGGPMQSGRLNRYQYADSGPLVNVDPSGLTAASPQKGINFEPVRNMLAQAKKYQNAAPNIGTIRVTSGSAMLYRSDSTSAAITGVGIVRYGDVVKTERLGVADISFIDGSMLHLGSDSLVDLSVQKNGSQSYASQISDDVWGPALTEPGGYYTGDHDIVAGVRG
jgi:RHS repeat-associated protein